MAEIMLPLAAKKELDRLREIVRAGREGAYPLTVDIGYGANWLEAH